MAGIGIITNPHSKLNKRNPYRQRLLSYIAGESGTVEITQNLDELSLVAKKFCAKNISILAINGGDGTISKTLTALIHCYQDQAKPLPKIAVLKGGTINMLAKNLKIKGSPEQILYNIIEHYSSGQKLNTVSLDTLKIADQYGFLFASGTSARFLKEFYKNKTGHLGSLLLVLKIALSGVFNTTLFKSIVKMEPIKAIIDHQKRYNIKSLSVLASTVEKIPFGFRLFPKKLNKAKTFQSLNIDLNERSIITKLIPLFVIAPSWTQKGKVRYNQKRLELIGNPRIEYTLDGELFTSSSAAVVIERGPTLEFLAI